MSFASRLPTAAALFGAAGLTALLATTGALSQAAGAKADAGKLRVCASKIEAPYSTAKGDGLENKLARIVAKAMGREVEFVWFDQAAIYLVRDGLDKELCDVVFGVDSGDERVRVTQPYFRTGYVYVMKADRPEIGTSWKDVETADLNKIAVRFSSPGELILKATGKYEENVSYGLSLVNFQDKRNRYTQVEAERLVSEVANGTADLSIAYAADVARFVKASSTPLRMTMIDDDFARAADGLKIPLHFDQAIGVRKGDEALAAALDEALVKAKPEIEQALAEEGVPLLKPKG
jgi:mxaJ protein